MQAIKKGVYKGSTNLKLDKQAKKKLDKDIARPAHQIDRSMATLAMDAFKCRLQIPRGTRFQIEGQVLEPGRFYANRDKWYHHSCLSWLALSKSTFGAGLTSRAPEFSF